MRKLLASALVTSIMMVGPAAVQAATLDLSMQYITTYSSSNINQGVKALDGSESIDPTWYHEFRVMIELGSLSAGQDFWAAAFHIALGSGLGQAFSQGWYPKNHTYTGGPPTNEEISIWASNASQNNNATMSSILLETTKLGAYNLQPGESGPFHVGTIFVNWDGTTPTTMQFDFSNLAITWGIWNDNELGDGTLQALSTGVTTSGYSFGALLIPEPGTLGLLALGGMALMRRRRA